MLVQLVNWLNTPASLRDISGGGRLKISVFFQLSSFHILFPLEFSLNVLFEDDVLTLTPAHAYTYTAQAVKTHSYPSTRANTHFRPSTRACRRLANSL